MIKKIKIDDTAMHIYVDTDNGVAGRELFHHGTATNPVNNFNDANILTAKLREHLELDHPLARAVREATKED